MMKARHAFDCLTVCAISLLSVNAAWINSKSDRMHTEGLLLSNPHLITCPTSNCPAPPLLPILSTQFIHGTTTKDAKQSEVLSNIGLFVKTGAPDGQKAAQYIGVMQGSGAGTAWALNTDLVRNGELGGHDAFGGFEGSGRAGAPGAVGVRNGSVGYELDFTNWDANSGPGVGAFTVGQYIHAQGTFRSTSAIYLDAAMEQNNNNAAWADGILFNGSRLISDNTFFDASSSINSLTVSGRHQVGLNTSTANPEMRIVVAREGQRICFNSLSNCLGFADGRLSYADHTGRTIFTIDEHGNIAIRGKITSCKGDVQCE